MIESISINNVASFDNDGVQITDLKNINFIYGANGSGKTIISNLLSNGMVSQYGDCEVVWEHGQQLHSVVYNKTFREDSFGKGTIEGVFTLGQATKEDIKLIGKKQVELTKLKEEGIQKKETLDKQTKRKSTEEHSFKEDCWVNVYKKHEHDFKEAFKGFMQKEKFKVKLLSEFDSNTSSLLTFDELEEKSKTIFGKTPEAMPYKKSISFDTLLQIENEEIWSRKIIGKSDIGIAVLIQKLNINDWVNQGRSHLQDDNTCPFCQQPTITDEYRKKLEDYFDKSFTASIKQIDKLNDDYNLLSTNLIKELTQTEANEKLNQTTKLNIDIYYSVIWDEESNPNIL